jgi:GAF domain-containing protein
VSIDAQVDASDGAERARRSGVTRRVSPANLSVDRDVLDAIQHAPDLEAALRAAIRSLARSSPRYHRVGIYHLEGDNLVLHNEIEKPSPHTRIPISQGLCDAAARERRNIVVDDVREDPCYLACTLETRSAIVVPIVAESGHVSGDIDIDSRRGPWSA